MSFRAVTRTSEVEVPRRMRVRLGFSIGFGSRFSRARLERALRGFLRRTGVSYGLRTLYGGRKGYIHCTEHFEVDIV